MQLTGAGRLGRARATATRRSGVLRRAVELGVNFIDTADSYGPFVSEQLIREALHPYPDDLVIATKAGLTRTGPGDWRAGRPARVPAPAGRAEPAPPRRRAHRPLPAAPHRPAGAAGRPARRAEAAAGGGQDPPHRPVRGDRRGAASEAQGDRRRSSPCRTSTTSPTASAEDVLEYAEREGHRVHPVVPARHRRAGPARRPAGRDRPRSTARRPSQLALAWLLQRSPVMLPIPGTSSVAHLEENIAAARDRR